tara:strand:- start:333 stop:542 length:210 start_codon:yes stop_codon:yes gene_type:complete
MSTEVSVHSKEPDHLDEIMIVDLTVPYATIWHSGQNNATRFDLHLKIDEAKALFRALKVKLQLVEEKTQ